MFVHEINGKETTPPSTISTEIGGDTVKEFQKIPPDTSEKLQKLGLTVTPEVFQRIQEAGQEANFQSDLSATLTNPSEKSRFEQQWLKGYGQEVLLKDGSKMLFADVAKLGIKEQEEVIEQISDDDADRLEKFIRSTQLQVANQNNQAKLQVEQTANQRKASEIQGEQAAIDGGKINKLAEHFENMERNCSKYVKDLQSIKGVPTPTPEELQKTAQNIPELQGANPEDIKQGKYDNVLLADYYIRNEQTIAKSIDPNDREKFKNSIESLSRTLERPYTRKFEDLTQSLVLGENRGKIETMGKDLIKSGYSGDVLWNPQDRTMTFTNEKGEKRIIDTARIPPLQRIQDGAVEISTPLIQKPENPYTTSRRAQETKVREILQTGEKLPIDGWGKVQKSPSTLKAVETGIGVLDTAENIYTEQLKKETEGAKTAGVEGETQETKALKEVIKNIQTLKDALISEGTRLAEIQSKESQADTAAPGVEWDIGTKNAKNLSSTGLGKFRNMDEVGNFLSVLNGSDFGNNLSDSESINTYLSGELLSPTQLRRVFSKIVELYARLTGNTKVEKVGKDEQYRLMFGQDINGKTRLENALTKERTKYDNRTLTRTDFEKILANTEGQKSEKSR